MQIHPHALAAAAAAEAAANQGRFWEMHDMLFSRQKHLSERDLRRDARELDLDVARFDKERCDSRSLSRVGRDVGSGLRSGEVHGTPTLFNGAVHRGDYDSTTLIEAIVSASTRGDLLSTHRGRRGRVRSARASWPHATSLPRWTTGRPAPTRSGSWDPRST